MKSQSIPYPDCTFSNANRSTDLQQKDCASTGTTCHFAESLFEELHARGIHSLLQTSEMRERGQCRILTLELEVQSNQIPQTVSVLQQLGLLCVPGIQNDANVFVGFDSESGLWSELHLSSDCGDPSRSYQILKRYYQTALSLFLVRRFRTPNVALLGPDGSGKSTLSRQIQSGCYFPVRLLYMGLYGKVSRNPLKRIPGFRLLFNILKQWTQYLIGRYHQMRGRLVVFDRYTYDSLLPSSAPLTWYRRLRKYLLVNTCPAPDLIVLLDAPGQILFDRKGEHTPEHLEEQRNSYRQLQSKLPRMVVVDSSRDQEQVHREVTAHIWNAYLKLNREDSSHA